ncbi:MAG: hypothetical protein S0880_10455 [Actinomycetota bacterium]|nr:hypothetical protein [Actinomycetota bacterium]
MALSATTSAEPCALVPPRRFGQVLARTRCAAGLTVEDVAGRGRDLAVRDLAATELGERPLADTDVARLADLYEIDPGIFRPERSQLVFDRFEAPAARPTAHPGEGAANGSVLDDYLAVVRALRHDPPEAADEVMALRSDDLGALADAVGAGIDEVAAELDHRQRHRRARIDDLSRDLRARRVVPAAGLLVSLTGTGALLLVGEGAPGAVTPRASATPTSLLLGELGGPAGARCRLARVSATDDRLASVGRAALDMIRWSWSEHLPDWTIEFRPTRTGYLGGTMAYEKRIELYVRDGSPADELAMTIAHELGHAIDVSHLGWDDRAAWLRARGLPADHPWWPGNGMTDYQVGAGDFAEKVAERLVGRPGFDTIGGPLTAGQARLLDALVPDRRHDHPARPIARAG